MITPYRKNEIETPIQERLNDSAKDIFKNLFAANTRKAYKSDLKDFYSYLNDADVKKSPEDVTSITIINYLDSLRNKGRKYATIQRRLISIRSIYKDYGKTLEAQAKEKEEEFVYHNPASTDRVKDWMTALKKTIGVAQKTKRAATKRIMNALINEIQGNRLIDIRNRAILAIGYAGAFRRAEIASLIVDDVSQESDGVYITLRKSKTDQEGSGHRKFIYYGDRARYCPVRLLDAWIRESGIKEGALFRSVTKGGKLGKKISDTAIYNLIRDVADKAGFDKHEFGGHSLRRGLVTQLADEGIEERDIMRHTGHRSPITVRRYIEEVDVKKKSPTKGIL